MLSVSSCALKSNTRTSKRTRKTSPAPISRNDDASASLMEALNIYAPLNGTRLKYYHKTPRSSAFAQKPARKLLVADTHSRRNLIKSYVLRKSGIVLSFEQISGYTRRVEVLFKKTLSSNWKRSTELHGLASPISGTLSAPTLGTDFTCKSLSQGVFSIGISLPFQASSMSRRRLAFNMPALQQHMLLPKHVLSAAACRTAADPPSTATTPMPALALPFRGADGLTPITPAEQVLHTPVVPPAPGRAEKRADVGELEARLGAVAFCSPPPLSPTPRSPALLAPGCARTARDTPAPTRGRRASRSGGGGGASPVPRRLSYSRAYAQSSPLALRSPGSVALASPLIIRPAWTPTHFRDSFADC